MKEWLFGQGIIFYVFAGSLLIGLIAAFVANHGYKRLIKETELMANTENRLLKYIKLKFGSYYKLNMKPQDTRALARHYMYKYKIGFMSASSWIKLSRLAGYAIGLAALADMLRMLQAGRAVPDIVMMSATALFGIGVLYMQNRLYNFSEKQDMLEWHLIDYLENFLRNKIESGKNLQMLATEESSGTNESSKNSYSGSGRPSAGGGYSENARPAAGGSYGENARPAAHTGAAANPAAGYAAAYKEPAYAPGSYNSAGRNTAGMNMDEERMTTPAPAGRHTEKPSKGSDEAAAAKIRQPYSRPSYYDPFEKTAPSGTEDEVDAKIVEDILKEFLN